MKIFLDVSMPPIVHFKQIIFLFIRLSLDLGTDFVKVATKSKRGYPISV